MIRRRASLLVLMGLVATVAVGLAAMKVATAVMSGLVFGLGLVALLVGTLVALVRGRGQGRATWIGFALFGWAYALVLLVPPIREEFAHALPLQGPLEHVVDLLQSPLPVPVEPPGQPPSLFLLKEDASGWHYQAGGQVVDLTSEESKPWAAYLDQRNAYEARDEAADSARRIALTFLGLAFALIGGFAGQVLSDRPADPATSPGAETPTLPG